MSAKITYDELQKTPGSFVQEVTIDSFRFHILYFYDIDTLKLVESRLIPLNPKRDSSEYTKALIKIADGDLTWVNWTLARGILANASAQPEDKPAQRPTTFNYPNREVVDPNYGFVYVLQSPTCAYKIGRARNPDNRLRTFSVKLPFEVEFFCLIKTDNMVQLEAKLHRKFQDRRVNGEWYNLLPCDLKFVKRLSRLTS